MINTASKKRIQRQRNSTSGFTLVEIMIVLAIIGAIFSLVGVNIIGKFKESKVSTAKLQIASLEAGLQSFYLAEGFYPHTSQGLRALVQAPTGVGRAVKNFPDGGHLGKKTLPKDPWNNDYRYECEDYQHYVIYSNGADGEPGTEDDVSSAEKASN